MACRAHPHAIGQAARRWRAGVIDFGTDHDESHAHPIIVFQSHVPVCSLTVWSSPYDDIPSDKGSASFALAKWCMGKHCP